MKFSIFSLALLSVTTTDAFSMMKMNAKQSAGVTSKTSGWEVKQISPVQRVEGNTRHTFAFQDPPKEVVQLAMVSSTSRPIDSEVNLWLGPNYTPFSLKCHTENGTEYPIQALMVAKKKFFNVEVKNVGSYNFPLSAACAYAVPALSCAPSDILEEGGTYMEGGSIHMHSFPADVSQFQVLLKTDGRHLKAKIEMLNGPNNVKQKYEVYASSGEATSIFLVFETPDSGNTIRVKNLASLEYPLDLYYRASKISENTGSAQWN